MNDVFSVFLDYCMKLDPTKDLDQIRYVITGFNFYQK